MSGRLRPDTADPPVRTATPSACWHALGAFVELCANNGVLPTVAAYDARRRAAGWPSSRAVRLCLGLDWRRAIAATRWAGRAPLQLSPVDAMLHGVRSAAAEVDGRLTVGLYVDWARRQPRPQPRAEEIRARFGSWAAACRVAGVKPARGRWTALEVVAELQRAYGVLGEPFTSRRFARWRETVGAEHTLSADVARRALGSWSACHAAASQGGRAGGSLPTSDRVPW